MKNMTINQKNARDLIAKMRPWDGHKAPGNRTWKFEHVRIRKSKANPVEHNDYRLLLVNPEAKSELVTVSVQTNRGQVEMRDNALEILKRVS